MPTATQGSATSPSPLPSKGPVGKARKCLGFPAPSSQTNIASSEETAALPEPTLAEAWDVRVSSAWLDQ